jgi:hypothetical protein
MKKKANEFTVIDTSGDQVQALPLSDDVVLYDEEPSEEQVMEAHHLGGVGTDIVIEITPEGSDELVEVEPEDFTITIDDIPGAPPGTQHPEEEPEGR